MVCKGLPQVKLLTEQTVQCCSLCSIMLYLLPFVFCRNAQLFFDMPNDAGVLSVAGRQTRGRGMYIAIPSGIMQCKRNLCRMGYMIHDHTGSYCTML